MADVECNCFNLPKEKYISGRVSDDNCPLCIDGRCTADKLELDWDGQYWTVSCPKQDT